MSHTLAQTIIDISIRKLNLQGGGEGDLLRLAIDELLEAHRPPLPSTPPPAVKKPAATPPKRRKRPSRYASWEEQAIATYTRLQAEGHPVNKRLHHVAMAMRHRGEGPTSFQAVREFLNANGLNVPPPQRGRRPSASHKPPVLPPNVPTADDLGIRGTPGWVRAEIVRLAALATSPEQIVEIMREWVGLEEIKVLLHTDRQRVLTAMGFKDLEERQKYIHGLALAFNKQPFPTHP